jgi:hypothetical protein
MRLVDIVVFPDRVDLSPPFTNQRVSDYERYVREVSFGPIRVAKKEALCKRMIVN